MYETPTRHNYTKATYNSKGIIALMCVLMKIVFLVKNVKKLSAKYLFSRQL